MFLFLQVPEGEVITHRSQLSIDVRSLIGKRTYYMYFTFCPFAREGSRRVLLNTGQLMQIARRTLYINNFDDGFGFSGEFLFTIPNITETAEEGE